MSRAICSSIVFQIKNNKSPSHLMNRYKLGRVVEENLHLTPFECLYLFSKNRIQPENPFFSKPLNLMEELLKDEGDIELYNLFELLKSKGFYVKRDGDSLLYRKSPKDRFSDPVRVRRENSFATLEELITNSPSIYATLDDEGDTTVFEAGNIEPVGELKHDASVKPDLTLIDGRYFSGKEGLPPWCGEDFKGMRILSEFEVNWLTSAEVRDNIPQAVYNDLVGRGLIVKTGFKYGSNFRAYVRTMEEHAEYLVYVMLGPEEWYKISRAVRVAQGVRKIMIFSGIIAGKVRYVYVNRVRDPFAQPENKTSEKENDVKIEGEPQ